jgi:hypothetical protein
MKNTPSSLLVFTLKQLKFYMEPRPSKSYEISSFELLVFHPKQITLYMGLWLSKFHARSRRWIIGLHPEANTVIYGNDYALVVWNSICPSVLID